MASVDPLFAEWLQRDGDYVARIDGPVDARWGATAVVAERLTGIATRAAADVEAARQLAFFSRAPFAIDVHEVAAVDLDGLLGRVVTMASAQLGYSEGVDVFVTGVEVDRTKGLTALTVLVPLAELAQ